MKVALLNSRKPRAIGPDDAWLRVTVGLARRFSAHGWVLRTSLGTLPYELSLYAALDAGGTIDLVTDTTRVARLDDVVPAGFSPGDSISREPEAKRAQRPDNVVPEALEPSSIRLELVDGRETCPARDRRVVEGADRVVAVAIRAGGTMESLLLERWRQGRPVEVVAPDIARRLPPISTAASGSGRSRGLFSGNRRLVSAGFTVSEDAEAFAASQSASAAGLAADRQSVLSSCSSGSLEWTRFVALAASAGPRSNGPTTPPTSPKWPCPTWHESPLAGPTLAHFTRAANGPWPGQRVGDHLEDLCGGGLGARRDGLATLARMLEVRRIHASSRLIRSGSQVVSFTAVPPDEVAALRQFRKHLTRWDFEPFGLVFDRRYLEACGARPVRYLPADAFRELPEPERPWYQKQEPPGCDYSEEREWRIAGDLDFSGAPAEAFRIYVPAPE